ncbi:hypothetical protein ADM90_03215 [Lysinibacillus macroides]|uniref:Methyltransferase domain-containing protein n=1 Tax=Lysinibacillus macroides TaxID=33935 RepID=A0A0M9DMS8_9BACI|nr:hypothetical protein ADM90_03215 [Lysinibacillus macroides]
MEEKEQLALWAEERKKHDLKYPDENVIRFLKKNFKTGKDKKILDFGCGSGRHTLIMAEMEFMIYAMDYNKVCLELTKDKLGKVNYKDVEYILNKRLEINLPDRSVDCIVAWGALFFFNKVERELFCKEMNRVLKPGGLILADYRTLDDHLYNRGTKIEENLFKLDDSSAGSLKDLIYWFCNKEELIALYEHEGFDIINIEKKELIVNNMTIKNSHFHIWVRKGEKEI